MILHNPLDCPAYFFFLLLFFHQLCWGHLNGDSLTAPLDRMRGTDDRALAVRPVSGQEPLRPTGNFLAGETQHRPVWGTSERVGWLPTRPGMAALAWPAFMDIFPWLPREVLLPVPFSEWIMSSPMKFTWRWRRGCYILHPVHFHGAGGDPFTSYNTVDIVRPPWLGLSGVFLPQSCPHWASSYLSKAVQVFLAQHCFPRWFPHLSLSPVSCDPLYLPVYLSRLVRHGFCPMSSPLFQV